MATGLGWCGIPLWKRGRATSSRSMGKTGRSKSAWLFLHRMEGLGQGDDGCDLFFSSQGHDAPALYAVLAGLGLLEFDLLHRLRRVDGLAGHPHVETPFIQANTGSLGMGISKAKGMAIANRLAGKRRRDYVLTGDGGLQEGQIWESRG